jgi:hypothetical protein
MKLTGRLNEPPCPMASSSKPLSTFPIYLQCTPASTSNGTQDCNQDNRANEGYDDRSYESTRAYAKQACQEATNERPDEANNDITNDTIATAAHNHACQEASD